jgi:hypothetical protein
MATPLEKRWERIERLAKLRMKPKRVARQVIINDGDEIPEEAEGELLICRLIVDPPEREVEEPPVISPATSPRTVHAARIAVPENYGRHIEYPKLGTV